MGLEACGNRNNKCLLVDVGMKFGKQLEMLRPEKVSFWCFSLFSQTCVVHTQWTEVQMIDRFVCFALFISVNVFSL